MNNKKNQKINKKNSIVAFLAIAMLLGLSSCTVDQEGTIDNDEANNFNKESEITLRAAEFAPNPNLLYHITSADNNRMIAANGNIFPFFNTGIYDSFSDEVRWKITESPTDGSYYIDGVGGDENPRMRSDDTRFPDMDPTTSEGILSQWSITSAGNNSYYLTTIGGTINRLTNGEFGYLGMTNDDSETISEQFILTEITGNENRNPKAVRDGTNHFVGQTITYNVLDNDFDLDGDELSVVNVIIGSANTVIWEGNQITVTRKGRFQSQIWYQISDGNGGTSWSYITLSKLGGNNG